MEVTHLETENKILENTQVAIGHNALGYTLASHNETLATDTQAACFDSIESLIEYLGG